MPASRSWPGSGADCASAVGAWRIAAYGFASASFFVATNLQVWLASGMYPLTLEGLATCFGLALPFFQNQLVGVAFYSTLLFGGWALLARRVPALAAA